MTTQLVRLSRPVNLLLAALTYVLGAGIADYLGESISIDTFWLGLLAVVMAQASMSLLAEVFRPVNEPIVPGETPRARLTLRNNSLYLAVASLTVMAVMAFLLFLNARMTTLGLLLIGLSVLVVLTYGVPPLRLVNRGFGEFLSAVHLAFLIPSLAFLLQAQEYHRLVGLTTVPLTAIAFAYFLVLDFPAFAADQKYERRTLLTMLGWQRAIPFHHALVVVAFGLFAIAPFLGFSLGLLWPAFITLPFAILQIVFLRNIALGLHPNWTLLTVNALAVFGLTAYFLTLTFYLR
jgi:1,4-dihydroxy-2-naphthoate octaprenyltransferase